MRSRATSYR